METTELLKKVRKIEIKTRGLSNQIFSGEYHTAFKGKGMTFSEVREYQFGDDVKDIDWNVTARFNSPYVKVYEEERELTVMLLLDASQSCYFGSEALLKNQLASELCSLLAFSAIKNNDKVGLIIFTDKIEKFVPPRKGLSHVLRVVRETLYHKPEGKGTDIKKALEYLNRVTKRHTISFVISDFFDKDFKKLFSVSNKRHDMIAVTITDPREIEMPDVGIIRLEDAERNKSLFVDTGDANFRKKYKKDALRRIKERENLFRSINVDNIAIRTDVPYDKEIIKFFRMRERRMT